MISRPSLAHAYDGRDQDCYEALEPRFLELLNGHANGFIDREAIEVPLLTEATQAGWAQHEISQAITELASRHNRRMPPVSE